MLNTLIRILGNAVYLVTYRTTRAIFRMFIAGISAIFRLFKR
jgi:hypothetical protein